MDKMAVNEIANDLIACFDRGNFAYVIGNGGSAAQAQHFAAELVGHFEKPRKALPMIALTTDTSALTAIGNDDGFEYVFSRQLEALGRSGDVLVVLSTSGNSQDCLEAIKTARRLKMAVIEFPTKTEYFASTAELQEKHLEMIHNICRIIDQYYA